MLLRTVVSVLLISVLGTSCSSSPDNELSSEDQQLISNWEIECSTDPNSVQCSNLVLNSSILSYASPYVEDYYPKLMADFNSDSSDSSIGFLSCDKSSGLCEAKLKIQNVGSSGFEQSLSALIIGNGGRFSATDEFYFDKPLNPRLFAYPKFYFDMGYLSEDLRTLRVSGWHSQEAEILLCKDKEDARTVTYSNCLRLKGWSFKDGEFIKQP